MASSHAIETISPSELHYLNSKITVANRMYLAQNIAEFSQNREAIQDSCYPYKTYPGATRYPLKSQYIWWKRLQSVLQKRRSSTNFTGKPISLKSLSTILLQGYGKTTTIYDERFPEVEHSLRSAPSGGALYPIEVYPLCLNIKSIPRGCYHYHVKDKVIEKVNQKTMNEVDQMFVGIPQQECATILVFTAIKERTYVKYGERGYRFLFLEAGHIAQNILLLASAIGLKACPIGGFVEDNIVDFLDIDHKREWVIYALAIGK
ncbi:SagB/ThcOx family dehydrogenase [Candidatus Uabimicrobium sp. HlEnr_7]|uniref:SagB/ThcOx family dehydrogenase n=1 Tax=Candidatus Uabimicrobium helgolandensis TaxID=3095367 RepID=UPI003556B93C